MVPQPAARGSGQVRKIRRLLNIVERLQGGRPHSAAELADFCSCSIRTIFRDLKLLGDVGLPIMHDDHRQGYWIPTDHRLPSQSLSPQEIGGIVLACDELGRRIPLLRPAREAALKLLSNVPEKSRIELRDIGDAIQIHLGPVMKKDHLEPQFEAIVAAVQKRRKVRVYYHSVSEGKSFSTLVSPYGVYFGIRAWYVVGRSSVHRAVRTFHLGRIEQVEATDDEYEIPPRFSIARYIGNAWRMIRDSGPDVRIVVRFRPPVASNVDQVVWHKTQKTKWNLDGTLHYEATVSGIHEIAWWILGYGEFAEVREPDALRELIRRHAERMVAIYSPTRRPRPGM
jgi:proteasome accessory factor B